MAKDTPTDNTGTLHTKYRPKTWEEVKGQDSTVKSVKQVLKTGSARAFLFTGEPGTGKTTLGRIIAREVGCKANGLLEINGADNSGADDMRAIVEGLLYRPMGGGVKVVIIDEAQRLSPAAWAVLLKPVEEPPGHVFWVFASTDPGKIPKAIQTRCKCYALKSVSKEELFDLLAQVVEAEGLEVAEDILDLVAAKSEGSPRQALSFLAQVDGCKTRKEAATVLKQAATEDGGVAELCKGLMKGLSWEQAMALLEPFKETKPESIRIPITHWFTKVALGAKSDKQAERAIVILSAFGTPYPDAPNLSPLILSLADIILA